MKLKNNNMEQKTNDNEMSQMERHVRRLLDKHKKRDEYEKSSSEKLAKKVESDLPELASALRSDDVKHFLNDLKLSRQSKEFTDALNFVLNYRENMEGMDGFIPSSDLAEMLVIYTNSQPLPNTVPQDDGWVRVEDDKPKDIDNNHPYSERVNITDGKKVWESRYWGVLNKWDNDEENITHWRNLPPPPVQ